MEPRQPTESNRELQDTDDEYVDDIDIMSQSDASINQSDGKITEHSDMEDSEDIQEQEYSQDEESKGLNISAAENNQNCEDQLKMTDDPAT